MCVRAAMQHTENRFVIVLRGITITTTTTTAIKTTATSTMLVNICYNPKYNATNTLYTYVFTYKVVVLATIVIHTYAVTKA